MSEMTSQSTGSQNKKSLPYQSFSRLELAILERALRHTWKQAIKNPGWHKKDFYGREETISYAIMVTMDKLNDLCDPLIQRLADVFDPLPEFEAHRESFDYRGQIPNKRPDLIFRPKQQAAISRMERCIVIESKVISNSRSMGGYCGDGLIRFVRGDYAWRMSQALMLGYVRDIDMDMPNMLEKHLSRHGKYAEYGVTQSPKPFPPSRADPRVHSTVHKRPWQYTAEHGGGKPGEIEVFHLWLKVTRP